MSNLRIRFAPYVSDSGNAIVPLRIIDGEWKQLPGNWQLTLNRALDVPVSPGSFTIQAFMPNGEVISEQVSVGPEKTTEVSLEPVLASPREDLAWGYLLKGTSRAAGKKQTAVTKQFESIALAIRGAPSLELWELSYHQRWKKSRLRKPSLERVESASFGVGSLSTKGKLVWLRIAWALDRAKFVALPPSRKVRFILFDDPPEVDDDDPINVVVDSGNSRAESILGYLRHGDFVSARQVGASFDAEKLLSHKIQDPASAAIGGYFLLQASELGRLHDWTKNLSDWFEYFPDGAVIRGWHALRSSPPDFDSARKQFVEAVRRGLPVYTIGLRLLSDGLSLCAARAVENKLEDSDVENAQRTVAPYVAAADWTSSTTSFYGIRPVDPRVVTEEVSSTSYALHPKKRNVTNSRISFRLSGTQYQIDEFLALLAHDDTLPPAAVGMPIPHKGSLANPGSFGQVDALDVVIDFVVATIATVVAETIKAKFLQFKENYPNVELTEQNDTSKT